MSKMAEEWGPWIGWNGGECPVDESAIVQFVNAAGISKEVDAADLHWGVDDTFRVIAYRVKREPVVETVRQKAAILHGIIRSDHWGKPAINGRLIYETRDGIPDMTTLRWEDAE